MECICTRIRAVADSVPMSIEHLSCHNKSDDTLARSIRCAVVQLLMNRLDSDKLWVVE